MSQHYDYIIAGAGAAGLSLAWHLVQSPLKNYTVLIVDSNLTASNDKTWCFWDSQTPPFSDIICKKWTSAEVRSEAEVYKDRLETYPYYCLRSIDFKSKILNALSTHSNFDLLEDEIAKLNTSTDRAILQTATDTYSADYIFQSCFQPQKVQQSPPHYPLLQHFVGWEIDSKKAVFDDSTFTLMDFDDTFTDGLAFMYLLPWSGQSGLIEYTVFSDQLLTRDTYEEKIRLYLNNRYNLSPIDYSIKRREYGKIPMQDRPFVPWYQEPRILNIGTVGGSTKPSTGYTFKRIQQQAQHIVNDLITKGEPQPRPMSAQRYKAYDLWLLQIIHEHPVDALQVFDQLFRYNSTDAIFRFLAEETNWAQDLSIMRSVPYLPFLRAIWKTAGRLTKL